MIFRCDEIINGESPEILLLCVVQGYMNKTDSFVGVNSCKFSLIHTPRNSRCASFINVKHRANSFFCLFSGVEKI